MTTSGIKNINKDSQLQADVIVGRIRITANREPQNNKRYVEIGIDGDLHQARALTTALSIRRS
jgi:hypothetical protein